ncbi:MAG: hypothetical protein ABR579_00695 [Actinomycetota bacterium]
MTPRPTGRINPLWRAAPGVLLRFRGLLFGQLIASALLTIAVVTGPMFLSATANAAINSSIARTDRFTSGFSLSQSNFFQRRAAGRTIGLDYRDLDRRLDRATSNLTHLGRRVSTIISPSAVATSHSSSSTYDVRMIARTDAVDHVARIEGSPENTNGVWIPDVVAHELDVGPSDELTLTSSNRHFQVPIVGVYKNLINTELAPFWSPLEQQINPLSPIADPPPPLLIGSRPFVTHAAHALHQTSAFFQWDYPIATRSHVTFDDVKRLSNGFNSLENHLSDPSTRLYRALACPLCTHYGFPNMAFGLQTAIDAARAQVDSLREPVTSVTSAAALVALVTIGAACAYASTRRAAEFRLLIVRGWSATKIAARSTVESVLPAATGAVAGYALAFGILAALGPGAAVTARPYLLAAATIPASLLVGFATTAALTSRTTVTGTVTRRQSTWMWEAVPLLLGLAAFYWSRTDSARFSAHGGSTLRDVVLLLGVPFLLVSGVAGIAARVFRYALALVGRVAEHFRSSMYLAVRRLSSAGALLTGMLVGSVLAVGIAAYGSSMASSMHETTQAKAAVFTGGDVSVSTQSGYNLPDSFPFPSTQAYQFNDGVSVGPSGRSVGLIAIDPASFAAAVRWYPSFSSTSLDQMLHDLTGPPEPRLPVVVVGDQSVSTLDLNGSSIPVDTVGRATAFPGIFGTKPWIVTDRTSLSKAALANGGTDPVGNLETFTPTWVRGNPLRITSALGRLGFLPTDILTTDQVLQQPAYLAATRTFRILQAIGFASALLAAIAILLYVQARQRSRAVVTALSSRMGLSRSAQSSATFAELAAMLGCAIAFGFAIGVAAAALIHGYADPLPDLPPGPLLRVSIAYVVPLAIGGLALSAAGATAAQVAAERANFAEAMRHAD